MIKAAVFDLDHTLFDRYATLDYVAGDFEKFFTLGDGITKEFISAELQWADRQYVHLGWDHIFAHLCSKGVFAQPVPEFRQYRDFVLDRFHHYAVPYSFTKPMLAKLKDMGIKTALITNGSHELQYRKLEMLDLLNDFDSIIATKDIGVHKPERGPFDIMAGRLRVRTDECLYIGDNPLNDVEGSRRAGCIPVWVRTMGVWAFPELEKPELQVDTVEEIPALIEKLNSERNA